MPTWLDRMAAIEDTQESRRTNLGEVRTMLDRVRSEEWSLGISVHRADEFGTQFNAIVREAGIRDVVTFGVFRKTCNDWWNAHESIPRAEGIGGYGRWILGHKDRDVNDVSYASVQHHIARVIDRFPYPWLSNTEAIK